MDGIAHEEGRMTGKARRLHRLFRLPGSRALVIPIDHVVSMGAVDGLDDLSAVVRCAAEGGATAVIGHRGGLGQAFDRLGMPLVERLALVLQLSGATNLSPEPTRHRLICSVDEAVRSGADAVSVQVNFGCRRETEMLGGLARVVRDAERVCLPVIVMAYVRDERGTIDLTPERVVHAARVAAELGADAIKVPFAGAEAIDWMTRIVPAPVLVAGGGKDNHATFMAVCREALAAGARGLCVGRNVFQSSDPMAVLADLHAMLCGDEAGTRVTSAVGRCWKDA